jgi:hypothetical protein
MTQLKYQDRSKRRAKYATVNKKIRLLEKY